MVEQTYQHIRIPDKSLELVPFVVGRSGEESVAGIVKHEDDCELVDGLPEDHLPHLYGDY